MDSSGQASSAKARWAFFLLMAGMVSAAFLYQPSGPSICTSKRLLNFACPGCGMMRSVCAVAQGRFVESVDFHLFGPLVFAVMLTLLGISVFAGYRVTLDLDRRRLTLDMRTDDPSGESFWWVSGQMLVRAGAGSGTEGLFIFDTGASGTVLASTFIEELEEATVGEATAVRSFGGMVPEARWVDDVELGFGGLRTSGPLRTYDLSTRSKLGGVEISGLLGLDLLGQRRIVIYPVAQRVGIASGRHER